MTLGVLHHGINLHFIHLYDFLIKDTSFHNKFHQFSENNYKFYRIFIFSCKLLINITVI